MTGISLNSPVYALSPFLTVSGDFVWRVEPPVSTRRGADVHVEMDVVSQPVAALFVVHKYRLLPVLRPFTLAA